MNWLPALGIFAGRGLPEGYNSDQGDMDGMDSSYPTTGLHL